MTRRITLSVLALLTLVLVLAVVPLGVSMAQRERMSFRDEVAGDASTISAAAEEHLSDHHSDAEAAQLVRAAGRRGDCATVYDISGAVVLTTRCADVADGDGASLVRAVLRHPGTRVVEDDQWLTTAVPVGETDDTVGVAVLSRSADPLDDRIDDMWLRLGLIATGGLAAAVGVSLLLGRWVGRPVHAVAASARKLGEGSLDARAPQVSGPPEVRQLAAAFNTMAARTEALVHGHRAVVADVSHQLRTPLAALRLRLDLLATGADRATAEELVRAQEEIARLSRLVDGLLAVARAENASPRPVPVRADEVAAERVRAWEPVARERGVTLVARCAPRLSAYLGPGDLEQVLDNLIANSLDAVPAGSTVSVDGTRRQDRVVLRVVDDGPGMSAQARESAFRRFGNPQATGTGLGLAIVHRLVTAVGGTAELLPTPGGGLTVRLTLPRPDTSSAKTRDADAAAP
ncbi:HAMP domain-containing histidine kinase [Streptomyces sp. PTM05]|uniref:histidine kinase n=1 Tax=Streptantibioticus parmotrematis TaxID=2873249 RepID=A0ABS7QW84_9ACTN|nr:HAMP domain-containing sensor histidine kinase [Streptantibioticus parmotrematis]MBY8886034.1 HAMP domain-containing histidine kinase [Streptantibioticus parmotrematis]